MLVSGRVYQRRWFLQCDGMHQCCLMESTSCDMYRFLPVFFKVELLYAQLSKNLTPLDITLPETNIASENKEKLPQRKLIFQTQCFKCYVWFREGIFVCANLLEQEIILDSTEPLKGRTFGDVALRAGVSQAWSKKLCGWSLKIHEIDDWCIYCVFFAAL